jgi:hypothetical protein
MKREIDGFDNDVVILFQLFNTPGTEIAPGSDEIGIKIESNWLVHFFSGDLSFRRSSIIERNGEQKDIVLVYGCWIL